MKQTRIFIAGTDTDAGKTYVSCAIVRSLQQQGISAVGIKPLASGCDKTVHGLRGGDALSLQKTNRQYYHYDVINPIALEPPIAPHIAAAEVGYALSVASLRSAISHKFLEEFVIVEGVGGWSVPLNERETMADFVVAEQLPVILVVGMRLGCLNHALLTAESIKNSGVRLIGWIANCPQVETMLRLQENIATLSAMIDTPCLGIFPHSKEVNNGQYSLSMPD